MSRRRDNTSRKKLLAACAILVAIALLIYMFRAGSSVRPGRTVSAGQQVTVGDVSWRVLDVRRALSLPQKFGGANRAQGVFMLVQLSAERESESGRIDIRGLALVDARGRVFPAGGRNHDVVDEAGLKPVLVERIQPRVEISGWAAFDVPLNSRGFRLRVSNTQDSGDYALIKLP